MDIRSFSINYETNLVVYDEVVTREFEADFLEDVAHSVRFSVDEYDAQRPRIDWSIPSCASDRQGH
jgi:phosphatidylserine/phosphatidylglycerophosphate/cardiolipin synthase-like enzyme